MMNAQTKKKTPPNGPFILAAYPLMLLMSMSIVYPYVKALDLRLGIMPLLIMNAAWLLLFTLAFRSVKTTVAFVLVALAAGGVAAAQYFAAGSDAPGGFAVELDAFLLWAGDFLAGYHINDPAFCTILTAIFSFIVCAAVAFFTVRRLDAFVVSLCGAACFVSMVVIGHTVDTPSLFACILAAMLYFLLQNYKTNAREVQGARARGLLAYMLSVLPFAAAVLALTIVLSSVLTIDPVWMKETRDKLIKKNNPVGNSIAELSGEIVISKAELGGPIVLNGEVLMEVESPISNIYLKGISRDVYTGHSWEKTESSGYTFLASDQLADPVETINALMLQEDGTQYDLSHLPYHEITVRYTGLKSGLVYLPQKTTKLSFAGASAALNIVGRDSLFLRSRTADTVEYKAGFILPDRRSAELTDLLTGCHQGIYAELYRKYTSDDYEVKEDDKDRFGLLIQALMDNMTSSGEIYAQYLQLPATLPQRVRDLAGEITAGESSDYERAKAIERYISTNYAYTLTPDSYDPEYDFVDEFLFTSKRGYCTYSATAMTVLLRCVGIPARYVEGYVMPGVRTNGVYQVTKREGHAWTEAYFEGFGWYAMEPTASFTMGSSATASPTPAPSPTPSQGTKPPAPTPPSATSKPASARGEPVDAVPALLLLGALLALAALAYVPLGARSRMLRMKPRDAAIVLFQQYLKLLAVRNLEMINGEPLAEFAARADELTELSPGSFMKAAAVFQLARYSPHEVTHKQKVLMLEYRKKLARALRQGPVRLRLAFYRYIWGI